MTMTRHAAIGFIVDQIIEEAALRGVSLSDVEREMLYFSESAHMPARMIEAAEAFERDYDDASYERKIVDLLRGAYKRTRSTHADAWQPAVRRVNQSDIYLGVAYCVWGRTRRIPTIMC
jgi:hypothetical protein